MVSIEAMAVGEIVRTEDIPQLRNSPIHFPFKAISVADLIGATALVGISSEDVRGEVFGHFRFELSIYRFEADKAYAFLISKRAVPLDPIAHVERAKFGDRGETSLGSYVVSRMEAVQVTTALTLEQVHLLLPEDPQNPMVMTRHPDLATRVLAGSRCLAALAVVLPGSISSSTAFIRSSIRLYQSFSRGLGGRPTIKVW